MTCSKYNEIRNTYNNLVGNPQGIETAHEIGTRYKDNITMDLS